MSSSLITNVDKKLLRTTKFPPEFDKKVDMLKVNKPVIKKWVADEVARILNNDDDIVIELISNVLEETQFVRHWTREMNERRNTR
jgi:serine/arginine repetitive matrix protein 1